MFLHYDCQLHLLHTILFTGAESCIWPLSHVYAVTMARVSVPQWLVGGGLELHGPQEKPERTMFQRLQFSAEGAL